MTNSMTPSRRRLQDVVGRGNYYGLDTRVLPLAADAESAAKLLEELRVHYVPSERLDVRALDPAS
jgi:hypothetical protein